MSFPAKRLCLANTIQLSCKCTVNDIVDELLLEIQTLLEVRTKQGYVFALD